MTRHPRPVWGSMTKPRRIKGEKEGKHKSNKTTARWQTTDITQTTDIKATRREQRKASPEGEAGGESCGWLPIGWLETWCMMMRTTKGNPGWWSENRKMISGWKRDKLICCTSRRPDLCLPWICTSATSWRPHTSIFHLSFMTNVRLQLYNFSGFALHLSFIDKCAFTTFQVLRYVYHLLINVLLQLFSFCGTSISIDKCAFTTFRVLRYIYHILTNVRLQLFRFCV